MSFVHMCCSLLSKATFQENFVLLISERKPNSSLVTAYIHCETIVIHLVKVTKDFKGSQHLKKTLPCTLLFLSNHELFFILALCRLVNRNHPELFSFHFLSLKVSSRKVTFPVDKFAIDVRRMLYLLLMILKTCPY